METKAELMKMAQEELPGYMKKMKSQDPKFLMPRIKPFPEVTNLVFKMLKADNPDEDKFSVKITVKIKKAVNNINKRTYHGACVSYIRNKEYEQQCVFENVSFGMNLYLKYYVEYLVYNVLSRKEINPNEWNNWDKKIKKYDELK